MKCSVPSGVFWVFAFTACLDFTMGVERHHQHHPHDGRHLKRGRSSLDDLLSRLDNSIQEHTTRLQRGLPTIHYRTDDPIEIEEGPTVIQDIWQDETHLEDADDDTSDYVNAAPWTRGPAHNSALKGHDLQKFRLASDNVRWVIDNGKCEVPLRRCVPLSNLGSGRKFFPRCALLHRCGDDAGCCNSLEHTCAVEEYENVDLYFYVYEDARAGVQMMTFVNHTKCSCQPKQVVAEPAGRPETPVACKCPKNFTAVVAPSGQCTCDCAEGKSPCRKYKKGKRYFSGTDIKCISSGECAEPTCEYGPFILRKRRCTKRRERERYTTTSE
ncbi:uncharacterized protein [Macrobrachium rosenbergii]|uniref:uncharacterized protein n=1 Tax=Macrobrachium rosenbergii TaxID=79674 RepID=UPI0034D7748B